MHSADCRKAIKRRGCAAFGFLTLWSGALLIAAAVSTIAVSGAHAQAVATSEPTSSIEPSGLAEIIVTARKRVESMQSIPESIDAFGLQEISDAHITKI